MDTTKLLIFKKWIYYRTILFKSVSVRSFSTSQSKCKKKKIHWHELETKKFPVDMALKHFDDFYKSVFRLGWPSVRLALLLPQKYMAIVNNFGDSDATEETLSNMGAMNIKSIFDVCQRKLKEDSIETNRQHDLEKIFVMDKMMDDKYRAEEEKQFEILYPDGSGDKLKELKDMLPDNTNDVISNNEEGDALQFIDDSRIIDPDIDFGQLNDFIPATKIKGMEDYIPESKYYSYYKPTSDVPIKIEKEYKLHFPEHLKVYSFDRGDLSEYPPPKRSSTGVYKFADYYLLDGASIMPVLALGLQPKDRILDMCAAPGGKSLAILQTMTPELLVCNDITQSRVNRIHRIFNQFLYDYSAKWKEMLLVQKFDGAILEEFNLYDKILVDVPCTNDRLSLHENDNNIFSQNRIKERLKIPEMQAALLTNALKLVRPGGTVVYSTCSLSPVQNDGVVGMALRTLWEEQRLEFTIKDMTPALQCTSQLYKFGKNIGLKFGHLVIPFLPINFGPQYFCKLTKNL